MKPKVKSKTLWFNYLTIGVTLAGIGLQYVDVIGLDPVTAGRVGLTLTMFTAVSNIILRLRTKEALE